VSDVVAPGGVDLIVKSILQRLREVFVEHSQYQVWYTLLGITVKQELL
jgi:hypothetical protein